MESKTPQFDKALDAIFEGLAPHKRICKWTGEHKYCEGEFEITKEDIEFLKMLRVPAPNYCPTCRRIRRFSHIINFRLFKIKCDVPNHSESMISIYGDECPFPVYDYKYFTGDEFDPFAYGVKYSRSTHIIDDLLDLRKKFPMPSFLNRDPLSVNSDFSNSGRDLKNAYYTGSCYHSENIWYSVFLNKSNNIMDSNIVMDSEFVYSSFRSDHIYKSSYVYYSNNCLESMFLYDCRNCQNCFGCVNLRGAKYTVFNKQLTKKEYENFINSIYPLSRETVKENEEKFWDLVKSLPINASRNVASGDVSGVLIKNTHNAFDVTDSNQSENVRHSDGCIVHSNSMDVFYSGGGSSLLYSTVNIGSHSSGVKFSVSSKASTDSEFIFNCNNINNCFMCFGLRNKSYCVLNIQYSKDEYYKIVDEIKSDMINQGEYGDGFGIEFSAQSYNFSAGQITFPLSDEEIIKLGGYVSKEPESNVGDIKIISINDLPKTINEVTDNILNYAIKCEKSGRPFKIVESELQFYREMKLPLPVRHPIFRIQEKTSINPIGKIYKAVCLKCSNSMNSVFGPKDGYVLYCEKCYNKEIY